MLLWSIPTSWRCLLITIRFATPWNLSESAIRPPIHQDGTRFNSLDISRFHVDSLSWTSKTSSNLMLTNSSVFVVTKSRILHHCNPSCVDYPAPWFHPDPKAFQKCSLDYCSHCDECNLVEDNTFSSAPSINPVCEVSCYARSDLVIPCWRPRCRACTECLQSSLPSFIPTTDHKNGPTIKPTSVSSPLPTLAPTPLPTARPTKNPFHSPSENPSSSPTPFPTGAPSYNPSSKPTFLHSTGPSPKPTLAPSAFASSMPTLHPSNSPSENPTHASSLHPSSTPTSQPSTMRPTIPHSIFPSPPPSSPPTIKHSKLPSTFPSLTPSNNPSNIPSDVPTITPSCVPSIFPSPKPAFHPSSIPSILLTIIHSILPSSTPTSGPTMEISRSPSDVPSNYHSHFPMNNPSSKPSLNLSLTPTMHPSKNPSWLPTFHASLVPSSLPTSAPIVIASDIPTFSLTNKPTIYWSSVPTKIAPRTPLPEPTGQGLKIPSSSPTSGSISNVPTSRHTAESLGTRIPSLKPSNSASYFPTAFLTSVPSEFKRKGKSEDISRATEMPSINRSQSPTSIQFMEAVFFVKVRVNEQMDLRTQDTFIATTENYLENLDYQKIDATISIQNVTIIEQQIKFSASNYSVEILLENEVESSVRHQSRSLLTSLETEYLFIKLRVIGKIGAKEKVEFSFEDMIVTEMRLWKYEYVKDLRYSSTFFKNIHESDKIVVPIGTGPPLSNTVIVVAIAVGALIGALVTFSGGYLVVLKNHQYILENKTSPSGKSNDENEMPNLEKQKEFNIIETWKSQESVRYPHSIHVQRQDSFSTLTYGVKDFANPEKTLERSDNAKMDITTKAKKPSDENWSNPLQKLLRKQSSYFYLPEETTESPLAQHAISKNLHEKENTLPVKTAQGIFFKLNDDNDSLTYPSAQISTPTDEMSKSASQLLTSPPNILRTAAAQFIPHPSVGKCNDQSTEDDILTLSISVPNDKENLKSDEEFSIPSLTTGNSTKQIFEIVAPAGPLWVLFQSSADGPTVQEILPSSPLVGLVEEGDIIISMDGVDTRQMKGYTFSEKLKNTSHHNERLITLIGCRSGPKSIQCADDQMSL